MDLDPVLFEPGREIGHGGAIVLTGEFSTSLKTILEDIAADMADLNTAGVYGLTLEFAAAGLPSDFASAGSHVFASGLPSVRLRDMLGSIATDLAAFAVAQSEAPSVHLHTADRIIPDFLAGGSHIVPMQGPNFAAQFGAGTTWEWIGSALYAIAMDLDAINTRDALGVSLRTTVTPLP